VRGVGSWQLVSPSVKWRTTGVFIQISQCTEIKSSYPKLLPVLLCE
jgi:hypothetical protein